ncbi:MAG: Na+/H+ antiporter NhaA [Vicinamibacterales bacterium]
MPAPAPRTFFQNFIDTEAVGGIALVAAAVVALVVANSPWAEGYEGLLATRLVAGPEGHPLTLTAQQWINDGLMAVFFLLVGLEIKREFLVGELSSRQQAALPIVAALGGVIAPAALYFALAPPDARVGWAVPTATDIAFALGVLALAAPSAPSGLKVFLAALAIVDDMAAILVIAIFYTASVHAEALAMAAAVLAAMVLANRLHVRHLGVYLGLGTVLWFFIHESGVHATVAGVLTAFTVPIRTRVNAAEFSAASRAILDEFDRTETGDLQIITSKGQQEALHALESASDAVTAPLLRLEHALHRTIVFAVMPVFALANAGVPLTTGGDNLSALAVAVGLVVGKPLGIGAASWLACRAGWASLPAQVTWPMLLGAAAIAGIGFTMSLFIAGLAFGGGPRFAAAQLGIFVASGVAAAIGTLMVRRAMAGRG